MLRAIPHLASLCCALLLHACGGASAQDAQALRVLAAASCADWIEDLHEHPAQTSFKIQLGPSSGLARQIDDGAPCDVFITAHVRWMQFLERKGRIEGEPVAFARNALVCATATSTTFRGPAPDSLAHLAGALATDDRIAIADASVPAGEYARQALEHAGVLQDLAPMLVGQDDARSTLRAVAQGQARVGLVYSSDARQAGLRVLFALDPASHSPIEYWACVVRGGRDPGAAREFLRDLRSPQVQDLLAGRGFTKLPLAPTHGVD